MLRFLLLFLVPLIPVHAVELLRDRHADKEYVFEADQSERAATIDAAEVTVRATDWATHFYKDLVHIENCEFRNKPRRFWAICFSQNEAPNVTKSFLVFRDTASPDGRYAIAWGLPNHPEIWSKVYQFETEHPYDAELSDEDSKRVDELFQSILDVENDVENYIVDVPDGRIVHKLRCPRVAGETSDLPEYWVAHMRPNRHELEVLWSHNGNIVLINHTFRWDCVSFCAVPVYAGQTRSELDLNKILGDAVRNFVAKSFHRGSGYSKNELDVSFSNLHQVGENQFSVQADAVIGKSWSADSANVDFSLSLSPKTQTKVLKIRVSWLRA